MRFSAPGRTEIGGNHTDHQHGCVLAAAVDLAAEAEVRWNGSDTIRIHSQGYDPVEVALCDLAPRAEEKNTTAALVRGVAAAFAQRGAALRGFDAQVVSTVLPGSGASSSAAFEVLLGTICDRLFMERPLSAVEVAQIGQWAENVYFGKPCGLMDQLTCAVGGMVFMDLADPQAPKLEKLDVDLSAAGLALCIIDSGADHADLTEEYAAIPEELKTLCHLLGKEVLREIPEQTFLDALPKLRDRVSDRSILRAIHFYGENRRVCRQVEALKRRDIETFLALTASSGRSSWMYLQNIIPTGAVAHQALAVTLAVCDTLLKGRGAFRVHGGGFAGTVQVFVPLEQLSDFQAGIERYLGPGRCQVLSIRSEGGIQID